MTLSAIPEELRNQPHWVGWHPVTTSTGKVTKVPHVCGSNLPASTTDPATWCDFETAVSNVNGHGGGIGWVVTEPSGYTLIDLDHVRHANSGEMLTWAKRILGSISSYAEVSPSGTGVHVIVRATLPPGARKRGACEMYAKDRFFCFTGDHVAGTPATVEAVDVGWLHRLMSAGVFDFAKNPKLEKLLNGDITGYASASEADLGFASTVAHLGLNATDIDLAFRLSGLFRSKWDEMHGAQTYGEITIAKSLQSSSKLQSPHMALQPSGTTSRFSDDWLTVNFATAYGADLRFTASTGRWNIWNGKFWEEDTANIVHDLAREVCRKAACEADAIKPGMGRQIASAKTISAVERLARTDTALAATIEEWDGNPWLLNCQNGVVDLQTGQLLKHDCQQYATKIANAALADPGTPAPLWSGFLKRATNGDLDLEGYLQRVAGCCLTGVPIEMLFFFFGQGANGKSTFTNTLASILGGYSRSAPSATFLASISDQHPTDMAGLRGARLVLASEVKKGRRWDESKIKSLTGGEKIAARFMRQDFFEFSPQFKLIISGNHRPALRSVNEAIRRRMHLIPFTVQIPEAERDWHLSEKLKAEWPAILRWMLDGCLEWQACGLNPPAIASEATKEYLSEENAIERWVEERCTLKPEFTPTAILFDDWKEWAESRGEYVGSIKSFSQSLEAVEGISRHRTPVTRGFRGIELRGGYHPPDLRNRGHYD